MSYYHHHHRPTGFFPFIVGTTIGITLMWMAPEATKSTITAVGHAGIAAAEAAINAAKE